MSPTFCPCCHKPMKTYKVARLGYYKSCLDHGTLASLEFFNNHPTRHTVVRQILQARNNQKPENQLRNLSCPICRNQKMKTTHFPAEPHGFDIDQCTKCDSIWLDADEMQKLFFGSHVKQETIPEFNPLVNMTVHQDTATHDVLNPFYYMGFPVKGEESQTNHHQLIAYLLLFLIVFVSWKGFRDVTFFENWMLIPDDFKRHGGTTLITSIFLHSNWPHLFSNMYFLFLCADNIEEKKGSLFVLELFLFSGVVGSIAYVLSNQTIPTIGASGAVSGILTYFAFQFPHARFHSHIGTYRFFNMITKNESVGFFLFIWFLTQIIGIASGGQSVNYWAHLGGALMGYLFHAFGHTSKKSKN